jgi:alanyl aminopeptidase
VKSQCTLLDAREGRMELEATSCPAWVMPNADGAGYFRFSLETAELEKLRTRGFSKLTPRERLAVTDSLSAAFANASISASDVMAAMAPLARDGLRPVATAPMGLVGFARERVADDALRPRVESWGQRLYQPLYRRLGWGPRGGRAEDGETKLLRGEVVRFLALEVEDAAVRREAARRGRAYVGFGGDGQLHLDAVDPNLADVALAVAVQDGDAALFDAVLAHFVASSDAAMRNRLLSALAHTRDETLAGRARALALDERLRVNEIMTPLFVQMEMPETREAAWQWVKESFDPLVARIGPGRAGYAPYAATTFCDAAKVDEVRAFFAPRIEELPGGPRNLASAIESLSLCAARVEAQRDSMRQFFARAR